MDILPGKGVGAIQFGESPHDVESLLGPPSSRESIDGWTSCWYESGEIRATTFRNDQLVGLLVVPDDQTKLWGTVPSELSADQIEQILRTNELEAVRLPGAHPAIRDRIYSPKVCLSFVLEDDRCVEIDVDALNWRKQ